MFAGSAGRVTLAAGRAGCGAGRALPDTGPGMGANSAYGIQSLLPRGCSASFTVGAGGSSRRLAEEAELSLKGHFDSSLSELIVHFSPYPDLPVCFGVRWGSFTTTAFSRAVEKSPWLRAQPCIVSCFCNNGYKGLKPSPGMEGRPADFRLCILSNSW